jgi:hypothetical protein
VKLDESRYSLKVAATGSLPAPILLLTVIGLALMELIIVDVRVRMERQIFVKCMIAFASLNIYNK